MRHLTPLALLAGWLGLLSSLSDVIEGLSSIGCVGFFVLMLATGIALLRRVPSLRQLAPDQVKCA